MSRRFGTTVRAEPTSARWEPELGRLHLCVVHSPDGAAVGQAFSLRTAELRLGRDPAPGPYARVTVDDSRISRSHASIRIDGEEARIRDLQSSNGLFVDGRQVTEAPLEAGTVLRVGDTLLVISDGAPEAPPPAEGDLGMVGRSPQLAEVRRVIRKVAPSTVPVLVSGETGTGKELAALALHEGSRRQGTFVPINCAALPGDLVESILFGHRKGAFTGATGDQDGAFTRAHGGTLFLDEVGELTLEAQPKLLRVLEDGQVTPVGAARPHLVDVRLLAATNVSLESAVGSGRFRQDLLARLAGVSIEMPPLRQRLVDLPLLLGHFLPPALRSRPASEDFLEALLLEPWPQNIRQLARLAERLALFHPTGERWELGMLEERQRRRVLERGAAVPAPPPLSGPPTREELLALLAQHGGNVSLLAKHVGRNRKQVYRWMDELGVSRGTGRDE